MKCNIVPVSSTINKIATKYEILVGKTRLNNDLFSFKHVSCILWATLMPLELNFNVVIIVLNVPQLYPTHALRIATHVYAMCLLSQRYKFFRTFFSHELCRQNMERSTYDRTVLPVLTSHLFFLFL